ncbi:Mitochondrial/chloroplast ribosomal protein L12 [Handroanthus impetiginosus]|uniref:Large ribosomal subunit protein bL12c n=1 Tax=Handroanthus impetiginosus TaxID=429701 RepID=A0A2G9I7D8_9LAMI|nr:Mitochondrial/chloroplast ribosomal protein L12 [Handroanthus impetiginosus]
MSLIARVRHRLAYGSLGNHIGCAVIGSCSVKSVGLTRHFAQPARAEDEDDEEVEIDQRRLPADYDPATFDPTEHRSPPTERVWRLVDEISGLTLAEAAELSSIMMRKLGMKEMPVVGVMKPGAAGVAGVTMKAGDAAKEEKKPEKTAFELKMESYDAASKLKVIKEIRSFTDLGLKEAKDLVEKTPAVLKKGVTKEEAETIIQKMKAVGANVVME